MTDVTNAKSDGSLICRFTYTYDAVGNRTKARRDDGVNRTRKRDITDYPPAATLT